MDTAAPVAGAEERKVRAARRFGLIGLVYTLLMMLALPIGMLLLQWLSGGPGLADMWLLLVLFGTATGLHGWRIREHLRFLGRPAPLWFVLAAVLVGTATVLVAVSGTVFGAVFAVVPGVLLGDVLVGLRVRWAAVWVVTSTAVLGAAGYLLAPRSEFLPPWWQIWTAGMVALLVGSGWVVDVERLWWLKAVTDIDDSRRTAAELATARERLRLADDLHDILGHALEVVAFKSELAARLLAVDPQRARTEMEQVQQVARESLAEVRAMVRETRSTDLVTELAGARAVLASAGIELVVDGDPAALDDTARNVLGRVLREAMTNVLRHAQPSRCTIEIRSDDAGARLRVVNDGALPPGHDGPGADGSADAGTGLVGLRRYLDEHAGRLDAGPAAGGTFALDAVLPVPG